MKKIILGLMLAAGLGLAGCQKSVNSEIKDVHDAEKNAAKKITDKERELQDTKMEEGKKILQEKREANDAINKEVEKTNPPPAVP
ncbi:hypothetical protein [Anatilimnocola floriformis]|uniref:hypothetical protein n=1 Tax=Anatilimnocola floriformis TaxID=2948575 RepID=UPI0020C3AACD|nr:hypothetical protein [Anatilimnocola floriformis]